MKKIIKNGKVFDGISNKIKQQDILIIDGVIQNIGNIEITGVDIEIIDASNYIVSPGFIDIHSHLREPGYEYKETIATGTRAASKGGFTTICAMPTTIPALDSKDSIDYFKDLCQQRSIIKVYPIGAVTMGREGKEIVEMKSLVDSGVIGFSDDGEPIHDPNIMRMALEYSRMVSRPIMNHCDDRGINYRGEGVMNDGFLAQRLGCNGIPNAAEASMLSRDIFLTELTGGLYHACHVSASQSVDVLKIAKERGINYSAEVTPHHLTITEDFILGPTDQNRKQISENAYDTFAKVFPPLRTKSDIQALIEGINSDLISIIATDHAPQGYEDKMTTLNQAAFGISNFETTLGSVLQLFHSKDIKLEKLLQCLTSNPAEFLGKKLGKLSKGYPADIVILDLNEEWEVDISDFVSLGKNSPLQGVKFKGKVLQTLVDGEIVYSDKKGHDG